MDLVLNGSCINDLPDEILAATLCLTIGDWSPRYDICLLELTCCRWRALAECTPTFWANVTASEGMNYVRQALIKSKDVSIDLLYDSWRSNVEFSQFMMEVDPHIQRWRSLTVYDAVAPSDLGRLGTAVAPRLVTLHLCQTCNIPFFGKQLNLFGGDASPTLRDVWFEGFPIEVNPSILQNLTSLTLKDIENVKLSSITTTLGASPCLKSLELANISHLGPPQIDHNPIQLNELQGIALHHLDPSATSFLLYTIRAPGCSSLIVNYAFGVGSPIQTFLTPNLSHLHSAMQHMAKLANNIEIQRHSPENHVLAVGDFRLGLETQENQLKEAFLWLIDALGPIGSNLGVRLALGDQDPDAICMQPPIGPRVTEVELFGPSRGSVLPNWVLAALGQLREIDPPQWTLPKLEIIDVRLGIECMAEVVEMLETRYKFDGSNDVIQTEGTLPTPLVEIHFWYIPDSAEEGQQKEWFLRVHRAVPNTKVFWGGDLLTFE